MGRDKKRNSRRLLVARTTTARTGARNRRHTGKCKLDPGLHRARLDPTQKDYLPDNYVFS